MKNDMQLTKNDKKVLTNDKKVYNMCCEGRKSMEKVIENSKNKMLKSCSILRKGLTIIEIFIIIEAVISLFLAINISTDEYFTTEEENSSITTQVEETEEGGLSDVIFITSVIGTLIILNNIKKMLKNIEDKKTPFNEYSIKVLKKISIILLVIASINLSIINFAFY